MTMKSDAPSAKEVKIPLRSLVFGTTKEVQTVSALKRFNQNFKTKLRVPVEYAPLFLDADAILRIFICYSSASNGTEFNGQTHWQHP